VASRAQLTNWVEYAHDHDAILLFDAAYEAYIDDRPHLNSLPKGEEGAKGQVRVGGEIPHSIFEIDGARECAIEFRSFSKTGGFTGVRCGFTVLPKSVLARTENGKKLALHPLWHRRWSTKSNGVSYPVQRGAEALYSEEGREQVRALIDHYMGNARILSAGASAAGFAVHGGTNAPYIWVETRPGQTSWQTFDWMLRTLNVVITPGSGFGSRGEGFFRVSAFNSRPNAVEVAQRLRDASGPSS
jgi:LL-diaminopimelate aminotransferase